MFVNLFVFQEEKDIQYDKEALFRTLADYSQDYWDYIEEPTDKHFKIFDAFDYLMETYSDILECEDEENLTFNISKSSIYDFLEKSKGSKVLDTTFFDDFFYLKKDDAYEESHPVQGIENLLIEEIIAPDSFSSEEGSGNEKVTLKLIDIYDVHI